MFLKLFNSVNYLFISIALFSTGCSKLTTSQQGSSESSLQTSRLAQTSNTWVACAAEDAQGDVKIYV
jgi:hypothetical protein